MGLEGCRHLSGGSCLHTFCHGAQKTQLALKKFRGLLVDAVGSLFLSQPPPCMPLPPGCVGSCLLFIFGQGWLWPQMTLVWSRSGSHGGAPVSFLSCPGTRAGSLQCLLRKYLLMEQEAFDFVFPAKQMWHLQNCGIPGSPWLCLSRFPCPGAAHQAIHSGTLMGIPSKRNRMQRGGSALH